MYLKRLTISNYKSFFEPKEFNFEPGFNVLLGGNSSGKTTVLEAICFHELQNTPHRSVLNVVDSDTRLNDAPTTELRFSGMAEEFCKLLTPTQTLFVGGGDQFGHFYTQDIETLRNRIKTDMLMLDIKVNPSTVQLLKTCFDDWPANWRPLSGNFQTPAFTVRTLDMEVNVPTNYSVGPDDLSLLWSGTYPKIYRFAADRAIQHACGHHPSGELAPNAANLAYCINHLQSNNKDLFEDLNQLLHRVFPTIHWVGAPPTGNNLFELKVHTNPSHMKRSDLAVPISRVGTGVGNALAMLYVALTAQTQRFILLEEPNSFLHPRALRELLAILAEIGGKHQFFITTHSSDVLRTIKASTVTLLEYDGQQTTIKQTRGDKLHELQAGLVDLGISLTDLHGCDKVLWVEGETEEAIFPLLLRKFFPELAQGIAVLPLHATGDFEAKKYEAKKVAAIYKTLSESSFLAPPMVAITLDREKKSDSQIKQMENDSEGVVYFLPKTMLEDYLLDVDAIASVLSQEADSQISSVQVATAMSGAVKNKNCLLTPLNPGSTVLHAANVLDFVFEQLATMKYHKTAHGPKIAEWLLTNKPTALAELKVWFGRFLGGAR